MYRKSVSPEIFDVKAERASLKILGLQKFQPARNYVYPFTSSVVFREAGSARVRVRHVESYS